MGKIAIVCPGQGSQTPGFLSPWLELNSFAESIDSLEAASGVELRKHGTLSDADTIRDTSIAQPLIVAAGIASLHSLFGQSKVSDRIFGVSGHSVGEITAAVATGILSAEDGIRFVAKRGEAMAAAAAIEQTSMAAILGGDQEEVLAKLAEVELQPANFNGGGQIVAAGSAAGIASLQANPPAGARVIPLQVAGAFHTKYMAPAVSALQDYQGTIGAADPSAMIWSNADGKAVESGSRFVELLVSQVSNPVRWDLCMQSMLEAGVTAIIEVLPGGTLTGLAKRSMPGVETLALKAPEHLEAAQQLISNHS